MDTTIERNLALFVDAAKAAFAGDLRSVVLFGSAAEDRLRATSDVNVMLVLRAFAIERAEALREALATAAAAIRLRAMFVLERELPEAVASFSVKFADIARRHRVLHGDDPFTGLVAPRAAAIAQLRQTALDQLLRLRARLIGEGANEERLAITVADAAGPLRACAAQLLALEGKPAPSPREALQALAGDQLTGLTAARVDARLPAGAAQPLLLRLLALAETMRVRAEALA